MASELDKGLALLKSLVAPHNTREEHSWRKCRACLASEELGHFHESTGLSLAQRELRVLLADYERLKALATKEGA